MVRVVEGFEFFLEKVFGLRDFWVCGFLRGFFKIGLGEGGGREVRFGELDGVRVIFGFVFNSLIEG